MLINILILVLILELIGFVAFAGLEHFFINLSHSWTYHPYRQIDVGFYYSLLGRNPSLATNRGFRPKRFENLKTTDLYNKKSIMGLVTNRGQNGIYK